MRVFIILLFIIYESKISYIYVVPLMVIILSNNEIILIYSETLLMCLKYKNCVLQHIKLSYKSKAF